MAQIDDFFMFENRVESQMGVVIVLLTDSTIRSTLLPAFTTG